MEMREISGLVLKIHNDSVWNFAFAKILTEEAVIQVKIPTTIENFSQQRAISPDKIVNVEIVKTKKNWILKNVIKSTNWLNLSNFQDYNILAQIIKELDENLKVGEVNNVLSFVLKYFENKNLENFNFKKFQSDLKSFLGFYTKN